MKRFLEATVMFSIGMLVLILFVDAWAQFFELGRTWNGLVDLLIVSTVALASLIIWKAPKI